MALIKHSFSLNALDAKKEENCRGDLDRKGDKLRNKAIGVQSYAVAVAVLQLHLRGEKPPANFTQPHLTHTG